MPRTNSLSFFRQLHGGLRAGMAALLLAGMTNTAGAAGTGSVGVTAFVPSKSNCKFSSGTLLLDFGTIDPASTTNATASASSSFTCNGSATLATYSVSAGSGLHFSGGRRMQHTTITTEYLPYAITISPSAGTIAKGTPQTFTVVGTIQPFEFQNAAAGAYKDTVVITLAP